MTRRLIMSFSLGLAALTACQTDLAPTTDTVERGFSSCEDKLPPLPLWRGEQLPATQDGQIYLLYPDNEKRGMSVIVLVDTKSNDIPFGFTYKTSQQGSLLGSLDNAAQYQAGRQPVPPRPLIPWSLRNALLTWGQIGIEIPDRTGEGGVCELQ